MIRLLCALLLISAMRAQSLPQDQVAPIERRDPMLDAASNEIGRALFLRCLCGENKLSFDAQGHVVAGRIKTVDWTLAGVNIQKAERVGPNEIELDGVRVAIRFAADRHEFERHPQKDETMRLTLADPGDPVAFTRELEAIFSVGIDRSLQRSLPDPWLHYFFGSSLAWAPDALSGQKIYDVGKPDAIAAGQAPDDPALTHKAEPEYTALAEHDRIRGVVVIRFVVDPTGVPRHITVQLPLGYGLDEKAVAAVAKLRFNPATVAGSPVAVNSLMRVEFLGPPPGFH